MISPADDIAHYLASAGEGTFNGSSGWAIFVGEEQLEPVTAITVYDTGGAGPDTDELDLFQPTFQVRVRHDDYQIGYAKQLSICDRLILPDMIETDTSRFVNVVMTSEIIPIGRDDKGRCLFTANYRTIRERK